MQRGMHETALEVDPGIADGAAKRLEVARPVAPIAFALREVAPPEKDVLGVELDELLGAF